MIFNQHLSLAGAHAFLSASSASWVNYDLDKLEERYIASMAAERGTRLHAVAAELIKLKIKQAQDGKTFSLYVNDAIGYRMVPEQTLFYSFNCFGTPDAIAFRQNKLRIHDLKTGAIRVENPKQLEVYAAIFCLEYGQKPFEIEIELRIYQDNEVRIYEADPDVITHIMDRIVTFDKHIESMRQEGLA